MGTDIFNPEAFRRESRLIWSEAAPHYHEMSRRFFEPISRNFLDFAGVQPGNLVLDIACGTGLASLGAARRALSYGLGGATSSPMLGRAHPVGKVIGVDLSEAMIKIARQNVSERKEKLSPVEFVPMSAEKLEFPDAEFDAVICQLGLMLFAEPHQALKEMFRVLKPKGHASCLVQGDPRKMIFTSLINKTMVRHAPQIKIPGAPTLYDFAPEGVLEKAFASAGFSAVKSQRLAGVFYFERMENYWEMMVSGAGKTGILLKNMDPKIQRAVKDEVFDQAQEYKTDRGFDIPYEFAMASGLKS